MSTQGNGKVQTWAGRVISALPVLALALSAMMKFSHPPQFVQAFVEKFGYSEAQLGPIGTVELVCAVLYAIPQTSVLGAVLTTGYLGGAIATHVRINEGFGVPLLLGVFVWAGLFLRDPRVRALLPWRR
jgi:hypothetical protein